MGCGGWWGNGGNGEEPILQFRGKQRIAAGEAAFGKSKTNEEEGAA